MVLRCFSAWVSGHSPVFAKQRGPVWSRPRVSLSIYLSILRIHIQTRICSVCWVEARAARRSVPCWAWPHRAQYRPMLGSVRLCRPGSQPTMGPCATKAGKALQRKTKRYTTSHTDTRCLRWRSTAIAAACSSAERTTASRSHAVRCWRLGLGPCLQDDVLFPSLFTSL